MARILIVTNGALSRNPRPLKEARALGRAGHDVTVLTVRGRADAERADLELLAGAPFQRVAIDVAPGFDTPAVTVQFRRFLQRAARLAAARCRIETPSALGPVRPLLRAARRHGADLTIVHNEGPHWVGTQLLARGSAVAVDIEDWHSEDLLPSARRFRPLRLIQANERALLRRARYTSTTSDALAQALHDRYGGHRPAVIANSFPLQPPPAIEATGRIAFFWFSQTLGAGRGVERFLAAWGKAPPGSDLVLLGECDDSFRRHLQSLVPADRQAALHFRAPVSPTALPAEIAQHHVGLALEDPRIPSRDLTITNKILQYLNAGLAVLATDTAGQREVLRHDPAIGILVPPGDEAALTNAIATLTADGEALCRRRLAARALAEQVYCWERDEPKLVALVNRALGQA